MIDRCEWCDKTSAQIDSLEFELEAKDKVIADWERKYNELSDYTNEIKVDAINEAINNCPKTTTQDGAIIHVDDLIRYTKNLLTSTADKEE